MSERPMKTSEVLDAAAELRPFQLIGMILEYKDFRRDELAVWIKAPGGVTVDQARAMCRGPVLLTAVQSAITALDALVDARGGAPLDGQLGEAHDALRRACAAKQEAGR